MQCQQIYEDEPKFKLRHSFTIRVTVSSSFEHESVLTTFEYKFFGTQMSLQACLLNRELFCCSTLKELYVVDWSPK